MTNLRPRLLCCFVCFIAYSKRGATGFRTASNSPLIKSSTIDRNVLSRVTHYSGRNPIYNHPVGSNINEVSERDDTLKSAKSPSFNTKAFITIVTIVAAAAALSGSRTDFDFPALLEKVVAKIGSLGPYGYIYFAAVGMSPAKHCDLPSAFQTISDISCLCGTFHVQNTRHK